MTSADFFLKLRTMPAFSCFLILCSAALYVLSFPPFSFSPLMWVALAPMFVAVVKERPRRAALYGLLWGVLMTCGFGWTFAPMVANYFATTQFVGALALLVVSVALFGVYFSAFAAWLSWISRYRPLTPLLAAAGWGTCEFARANVGWGNPLALASYSQVEFTRLSQIADITGPYGVGMLIAAVNAVIAGFWMPAWRGSRPVFARLGVAVVCCVALGYGAWRLTHSFAQGEPVKIAVIQGAIESQQRWNPRYSEANLARYIELTKTAMTTQPRLIFWPEYAVSFPLQRELPQRARLFASMQEFSAELITGGPYFRFGAKDIHNRNSVFLIRDGALAGRYDKLQLVPFAEDERISWLSAAARLPYEPGAQPLLLRASAAPVGIFLCIEAFYPDLARNLVAQGAQVLANPSNDDWFGNAAAARHMLDIATLRAIETRRYLVRPTTTGFSAVIDPHGRLVSVSDFSIPAVLTAEIYPSVARTIYGRWGDVVAWLMIAAMLSVSLIHARWLNWYTWNNGGTAI